MNKHIPQIVQACLLISLIVTPSIAVALCFITISGLMAFKEHSEQKPVVDTNEALNKRVEQLESQVSALNLRATMRS